MKRIVSFASIILVIALLFTGCKSKDTILFSDVNLSKYIELGEYKEIPVDTSSETFKEVYDELIASDVSSNEFYVHKTEGNVAFGDTVNIDYLGKIDGVAFDGGTAKGQDLLIGSKKFIDGFEDGLIGVAIGSTVDLNLKFPDDYHVEEYKGKKTVFTVKVNYVKTQTPQEPKDFYSKLGYASLEDYEKVTKEKAIQDYLVDTIMANSKFKDYPADDIELIYQATKNTMSLNIEQQYGMKLSDYFEYLGKTEEEYKADVIEQNIKPFIKTQMVMYSILEKEKIQYKSQDATDKINELIKQMGDSSVLPEDLINYYGEYYFENMVVNERVMDFIYKSAKIS